jgi:hypothetical protein
MGECQYESGDFSINILYKVICKNSTEWCNEKGALE